MCGIIGYTGCNPAVTKIVSGLAVLEYRGYDSAGVAAICDGEVKTVKCCGRVTALCDKLEKVSACQSSLCAIGHTRWATHGRVNEQNAHPHTSGHVTLAHNGIIENEKELRAQVLSAGVTLHSETDSEVVAALFDRAYRETGEPIAAIYHVLPCLRGSYAFAILFADRCDEIYAVRQGSPLLAATGLDGSYLASDPMALAPYTETYCLPEENVVLLLKKQTIRLYTSDGQMRKPSYTPLAMKTAAVGHDGYDTFMRKEIGEQPQAIMAALQHREENGLPSFFPDKIPPAFFAAVRRIHIVACGSAMHAGLLGARWIEQEARCPVAVFIASEYRYHMPPIEEGTLMIAISQSGETADTLAAVRIARAAGLPILAIVNAENTAITREADYTAYTHAGPEIAVATTKGYSTQIAMLRMIALYLANMRGRPSPEAVRAQWQRLTKGCPAAIRTVLAEEARWEAAAEHFVHSKRLFLIGRGQDYALAAEGALKMKEISYLPSEAYAAGELKHGTLSLIEPNTPVIALCTDEALAEKMNSNVREVSSRGGCVFVLCTEACAPLFDGSAEIYPLKSCGCAAVFAAMAALQLLAYHTARRRGCDIDKPRNLAKSVTVE